MREKVETNLDKHGSSIAARSYEIESACTPAQANRCERRAVQTTRTVA